MSPTKRLVGRLRQVRVMGQVSPIGDEPQTVGLDPYLNSSSATNIMYTGISLDLQLQRSSRVIFYLMYILNMLFFVEKFQCLNNVVFWELFYTY